MDSLDAKLAKNSTTFAKGDPVSQDTDGLLIVTTAGLRVIGIANEAKVTAADNETVAQYKVQFLALTYKDKLEAEMSAAVAQTNVGQYADVSGTTGAVKLDSGTLADDTGSFHITDLDPRGNGSTTAVLCNIAEPEELAYTQN